MFPLGSTPSKRPKRRVESYRILYAHILHALSLPGHPLRVTEKATHGEQVGLYSWHSRTGTSITINIVPKCEVCPRDHGKVVESLRGHLEMSDTNLKDRVTHLQIHANIDLNLINIYATSFDRKTFYLSLNKYLANFDNNVTILMGNFN